MKRPTATAAPLLWTLAVAQVSVGVLEGTFALTALGVAQGADMALSGSDDREYPSARLARGCAALVSLLFGLAAVLTIVYAALALVAAGSPPGHSLSLWLAAGSTVLVLAWWRAPTGAENLASVTMQTIFALAAVISGEYGWDWSDPLGGLLLANAPLRTAWKAAAELFPGARGPEAAGDVNKQHKSA